MALQDYEAQFCCPHTGMVYTPPSYSDHIGVAVVLRLLIEAELQETASTKAAQPFKGQARISSFFAPSASKEAQQATLFQRLRAGLADDSADVPTPTPPRSKSAPSSGSGTAAAKKSKSTGSLASFFRPKPS